MVILFIITTFLLITGGKTAPDYDLGAIVKNLELRVDQALRDLTTELVHTKKRIYDLEEQLKTFSSSKQDLPKSEKEFERHFSTLPVRSTRMERDTDFEESTIPPTTHFTKLGTTLAQFISQVVQEQLRDTFQGNATNETCKCSIRPGPKGEKGDEGRRGVKGDQGDQGPPGIQGSRGERGQLGYSGYKGQKGEIGDQGPPGIQGSQGEKGQLGYRGSKGQKGVYGNKGSIGPQGLRGPVGLKGAKGDTNSGSTYIRWGRDDCPSGAVSLYSGRVAGTKYDVRGGTSDYLCLPDNPRYGSTYTDATSPLYGVEYQRWPTSSPRAQYDNTPCVVCYIATRSAMFVHQASYLCPSGWSREYYGYMMSDAVRSDRQGRRSTICVDANAEAVPGTGAKTNPSRVLFLSVECTKSELLCSPYVDGRILSCAVCTK